MKKKLKEAEVLSVAAGNTYEFVMNHLIHACPNDRDGFKYRPSRFICFRKPKGGEMEAIYEIESIIVLNPYELNLDGYLVGLDTSITNRIKGYIKERLAKWEFSHPREHYRFYILSEKGKIDLPHLPRPNVNNPGARYYSLAELKCSNKIVQVESRKILNNQS
jgi:hypothetical protein